MNKSRYKQARRITLIGAAVNIVLGFIKVIGGWLFNSNALIADGVHSFSDLLTDFMVIIASKYGSQGADLKHPYGHQRIETASTLMLSFALILVGGAIAWDAIDEIIHHIHDTPDILAIPIAIISIVANEILFQYTSHVGLKIKSDLVIVNAWHHRSDAASSVVVLFGLIGSLAGYRYFDAIAAIIVSTLIIKMGWDYGWRSIRELIDTAVEPKTLAKIEKIINNTDGILKVHQLRSRLMAGDIFVDVHIQVSPKISVSEGHYIAQYLHQSLMDSIEKIKDVTVHVDPEDDESAKPSLCLPSRRELEESLILNVQTRYPEIQSWLIHYLDGKVFVDFFCQSTTSAAAIKAIKDICESSPYIAEAKIFKAQES